MGEIVSEVRLQHLTKYPKEEEILRPFLNGFDVTWAQRRRAYNAALSVYFLKPEPFMEDSYGFSREVLMVYSPFGRMEPRAIQAAESFLVTLPAFGRVESLNYFLISDDSSIQEWTHSYTSQNPEARIIVPFNADELRKHKGDSYYIRNIINKYLYGRDLFDYRLPIEKDYYFFGRKEVVASFYEAIIKNENKGLFGLRKTGKTSILYKLERQVKASSAGLFLIFDCKSPSIRMLRWNQLFEKICEDISQAMGIKIEGGFDEIEVADTFARLVAKSAGKERIILVFDEIEYISPIAVMDLHWKMDFIKFWQTFWAVQSRYRNICTIIVGVNPYPLEIDTIDGIQNPLFGIVPPVYLQGLVFDDMKMMVRTLGKRMGLRFDQNSLEYIYARYGGHPLLTRLACSILNTNTNFIKETKPIDITYDKLKQYEKGLDATLLFYYRHVVSELKQFYPDEYEMLELLASGQKRKFAEESKHPEHIKHLLDYGLLSYDGNNMPKVNIPVIERYIGYECARREGRKTIYKVIEPHDRPLWLNAIVKSIITDLGFLEDLIQEKKLTSLFGPNSFAEEHQFCQLQVVSDKANFGDFLNTCNRCFIESIDNYGKSISRNDYFWKDIKDNYPSLWNPLYRIKVYRHNYVHRILKDKFFKDFMDFINTDLEGQTPSEVKDLPFVLSQCVLEGLLTGIQIESNKLTS